MFTISSYTFFFYCFDNCKKSTSAACTYHLHFYSGKCYTVWIPVPCTSIHPLYYIWSKPHNKWGQRKKYESGNYTGIRFQLWEPWWEKKENTYMLACMNMCKETDDKTDKRYSTKPGVLCPILGTFNKEAAKLSFRGQQKWWSEVLENKPYEERLPELCSSPDKRMENKCLKMPPSSEIISIHTYIQY